MTKKILNVDLGDRSYPIYIGKDLLADTTLIQQHIRGKQVVIISNDTVAPLYLSKLQNTLSSLKCHTIVLADGEQYKNLTVLNDIFTELLQHKYSRQTTLIALGGGVIGDISGFAAACYLRGIPFIQIPTTLLAQVDSSVGGKTAVNHELGKNMIGAFYQPQCVIADTSTLDTLPDRELSAGLAEIIKYGLIRDPEFYTWLETNIDKILARDTDALVFAIERSCLNKAEIVSADECESGIRALLNLGHTFGHAIETFMKYQDWLHGEAVSAGIQIATELSKLRNWLSPEDTNRVKALLLKAKLPVYPPQNIKPDQFIELMGRDKKVVDGVLRLVLLKSIGEAVIVEDTKHELIKQCLTASLNQSA